MNKYLLIVGGGVMQMPAIKTAKEMGLIPVVMDIRKDAPGMEFAAHALVADISDPEICIEKAADFFKNNPPLGVITIGTDFPSTVARLAKYFGLVGISPEVAEIASNKFKMRKCFERHGVAQPRYWSEEKLYEELNKTKEISNLPTELVVKPVDSMGARGVQKVLNFENLKLAISNAKQYSKSKTTIIEEYVEGKEFSIDALIYKKEIIIQGIADRIIDLPPYFVELGHVLPTQAPAEEVQKVCDLFKQGIKALGIENGAAKGDILYSNGKAYVGEIAARLSGGYMSGFTYPYATGINLIKNAIWIALDKPPADLIPKHDKCAIEKAIVVSRSGKIRSINGLEKIGQIPEIKDIFLNYKVGDYVTPPKNNVEKGGNIIVLGDNYKHANQVINKLFSQINIVFE